jgi:hypothetical protein
MHDSSGAVLARMVADVRRKPTLWLWGLAGLAALLLLLLFGTALVLLWMLLF